MSALNIICQRRAVHLISDGSIYDSDGTLLLVSPKVWPLPHLNAVIAARGPWLSFPLMTDVVSGFSNGFDHMRDRIAAALQDKYKKQENLWGLCGYGPDMEIVIAGFSETRGPCAYIICSHERYGFEPWVVKDLGEFAMTPSNPDAQREVMADLPPGSNVETIDVEFEAVRMLEIQRKVKIEHRDHAEGISIVGGFAMITSVAADAITSKVLRRWPDKIGEKIDPTLRMKIERTICGKGAG